MESTLANPYQVLGVAPDADPAAIKSAWRAIARECHPDRNRDAGAEVRFKAAGAAYEVLSDPPRRAALDAELDAVPRPCSACHTHAVMPGYRLCVWCALNQVDQGEAPQPTPTPEPTRRPYRRATAAAEAELEEDHGSTAEANYYQNLGSGEGRDGYVTMDSNDLLSVLLSEGAIRAASRGKARGSARRGLSEGAGIELNVGDKTVRVDMETVENITEIHRALRTVYGVGKTIGAFFKRGSS